MRYKWNKKSIKIIFLICSILIAALICMDVKLRHYYSQDDKISFEAQTNGLQYLSTAIQCIDRMEKNGIPIKEEYKEKIREYSEAILEDYSTENLSSTSLVQLMYIDHYYNGAHVFKLNELFNRYYDKDNKILSQLVYDSYYKESIEDEKRVWIALTTSVAYLLDQCGSYTENYGIREGLSNWFNQNVDKLDILDVEEKEIYLHNCTSIFGYMYNNDCLQLIEYKKIQPYIKKDVISEKEYLDKNTKESSLTKALYADEVSAYQQIFHNDDRYKKLSKNVFDTISNSKELEYEREYPYFVSMLFELLKTVESCSSNSYFTESINEMLYENFLICFEELLSTGIKKR